MSVLFLFGAGASYGSENDTTNIPKLGVDLFQALRDRFPLTWGTLDLKYGDLFRKDFEKGMDLVLERHPKEVSELQRSMAEYFFNFIPSSDSLYIRLIKRLGIKNVSFSSLNYDRLLEESIIRSGYHPNYTSDQTKEKEVGVCLPHGGCNLFLKGLNIPPGSLSFTYAEDVFDSTEIDIIRDYEQFKIELKSRALPPIMACFNSKKTSAVGRKFLEIQARGFEEMVLSSGLIVIVGVNVREHDRHIWSPLTETKAKLAYCSGRNGAKDFNLWNKKCRVEKKDQIFQGYFVDHFEEICEEVESFLRNMNLTQVNYN
ncbi:MAG: hypothetical protein KR126chlam6_01059 [Candidatus Anoxychlamydiales bacterium]|nr:hypothetical protein [Candidatus Anoxychlamydiales bacterium]